APYEALVEAKGGETPYAWTLVEGALPTGVGLSEGGTLRGTPAEAGSFTFTARVTDAGMGAAQVQLDLTVLAVDPPLVVVTAALPDGTEAEPYSASVSAEGGAPPYTWAIIGEGPPGLTLDGDGGPATLSGTPTVPGTYDFELEVEDSKQARARRGFSVEIAAIPPPPTPPRITTAQLPDGEVNRPYSAELAAVDGAGPTRTWSIADGALPPGLALDPAGAPGTTLTGTPAASGAFTFTVEVRDAEDQSDEATFTVVVRPELLPIEIVTSSVGTYVLPSVVVGESYQQPLTARFGSGVYAWSVSAGQLPPGLALEASGTPATQLVGVAGAAGTFDFTVTVTDVATSTDSQAFQITVLEPANLLTVSTATLTPGRACHAYEAALAASGGSGMGYQWTLTSGVLPAGLVLDGQGNLSGIPVMSSPGSYPVTVTVTDSDGGSAQGALTMTVTDDGTGDRFVAISGDTIEDNRYDILVADVCRATPTLGVRATPPGANGDARFSSPQYDLSPDGRKVAFIGDFRATTMHEVWVADLTLPPPYVPVIVSPPGGPTISPDAFDLGWSPTGDHLVFRGNFDVIGDDELFVVDTRGGIVASSAIPIAPTPPVFADVDSLEYSFSPDGRYLAYAHDTTASAQYDLWVYDLWSATPRSARRVNPPHTIPEADAIFPVVWIDDTRLLYGSNPTVPQRTELFLADVSGATITTRVVSDPGTSGTVALSRAVNAPRYFGVTADGRWAWYIGNLPDATRGRALFRVDLSDPMGRGEAVHVLPPGGQNVLFAKPASGARIVVLGNLDLPGTMELFVLDLGLPVPQDVTAAKISGVMQPAGGVSAYEVSPDGRYVVFVADKVVDGLQAAFLADLDDPAAGVAQLSPNTTNPSLNVDHVVWSPTSSWVAMYGDLA
ncbi:MAG: putative Ig domain-containing protein, partial [Alphaproteobacteria bacterium]|nr:putative Ig domain-containing protein [Alphaproteobacteria bacterium]